MAKTSMIVKQKREQKFKVREYTRCEQRGRPHSVIRKFKLSLHLLPRACLQRAYTRR